MRCVHKLIVVIHYFARIGATLKSITCNVLALSSATAKIVLIMLQFAVNNPLPCAPPATVMVGKGKQLRLSVTSIK